MKKSHTPKSAKGRWGGPRVAGPGKRIGRPPFSSSPKTRHNVLLSHKTIEQLHIIGNGIISRGIEIAVEQYGAPNT